MSWREKQGAAKFRGVPFFVDSAEQAGGRQTVTHAVPFTEAAPFTEDLGLKGRTFNVEGYVVGEGYEGARDALLSALEAEGPGELVHPYHGTRRVAVVDYTVRQNRTEGGFAQFRIQFAETSAEPLRPTVSIDGRAVAAAKVSAAKVAANAQFAATIPSAPFSAGFTTGPISAALPALSEAVLRARSILSTNPIDPLARARFDRFFNNPPTGPFDTVGDYLVSVLGGLVDVVLEAVTTATAPLNPSALLLRLAAFDPNERPIGSTPDVAERQAAYDSVVTLVRRLALAGAATALLGQTFASYDDAVDARDAVTDAIDDHAASVTDDTFPALTDLRVALVDAVPGADEDLPRLQRYTPPAVLPSLVVAHRLYGALDLEADLVERNRVRHPGFVPPEPLEVLTDA